MRFDSPDDALRAHADYNGMLARHWHGITKGWIEDRLRRYGASATAPCAAAFKHAIEDSLNADTLYMTHEMMDLTQTAMDTFDDKEAVSEADIFIPSGFMVLPEPFYSRDAKGLTVAMRAIGWRYVDALSSISERDAEGHYSMSYDLNEPVGGIVPGVRFMILSWVDDREDDFPLSDEFRRELHETGMRWGIVHGTALPLEMMNDRRETRGEGDHDASWLLFWRVAQKLMQETIITSERFRVGRPARREVARLGYPLETVRIIELRRSRPRRESDAETGRQVNWTHRWIVRGFWRRQWYPSRQEHRQKYIGEHVRGPEDLPLVIKNRVWNWDR